jgi:2-phospho-L-lactate/phosphoenolpyruvate guanylyltransferase
MPHVAPHPADTRAARSGRVAGSTAMPETSLPRFGAVVPVKPPAFAKSRLRDLGDRARRDLADAFAADTVTAALDCPRVARVLVVTDDHRLAAAMVALGADVVPDGTSDDLNGTLRLGAAELHRRDPDLALVALCADLPALRPDELTRVLDAAAPTGMSFLADADGVGTTVVVAATVGDFAPAFGGASRQRHLDAGATEVVRSDVPSVRRDVDDRDALLDARRLGLGPRTASVVTGLDLGPPPSGR